MEIDKTVPSNKCIRERRYFFTDTGLTWGSENIIQYPRKKQRTQQCKDLLKALLSNQDLMKENIGSLPHKKTVTPPKIEIKAEYIIDSIIEIDDDIELYQRLSRKIPRFETTESTETEDSSPSTDSTFIKTESWNPPGLLLQNTYYFRKLDITRNHYVWIEAKLVEITLDHDQFLYKMEETRTLKQYIVTGHDIAYKEPPTANLKVGSRVIGVVQYVSEAGEFKGKGRDYQLGVVGEIPSIQNDSRYLIIFDSGHWLYLSPKKVRLVHRASDPVWLDIADPMSAVIQEYLEDVDKDLIEDIKKCDTVQFILNGASVTAQVLSVDSSLILVYSNSPRFIGWMYRGVSRFKRSSLIGPYEGRNPKWYNRWEAVRLLPPSLRHEI